MKRVKAHIRLGKEVKSLKEQLAAKEQALAGERSLNQLTVNAKNELLTSKNAALVERDREVTLMREKLNAKAEELVRFERVVHAFLGVQIVGHNQNVQQVCREMSTAEELRNGR